MNFLKTKIKKITIDNKYFTLECDNINFKIKIYNGTIDIKIETTDNEHVGYNYLEENDIIKIFYKKKENIIIPKKIFINTKYNFNSESSDFETI